MKLYNDFKLVGAVTVMIYFLLLIIFIFNTDEHLIYNNDCILSTHGIHGTHTLAQHNHKYYIPFNIYNTHLYDYTRVVREEARESFR